MEMTAQLPSRWSELGMCPLPYSLTPIITTFHSFETLFYKSGVDIILEAHEHSYERMWPVYNETVTAKNYVNPAAPVHLVSGTAGCKEGVDPMIGPRGKSSPFLHHVCSCY